MFDRTRMRVAGAALAVLAGAVVMGFGAAGGAAAVPGCEAFGAQGDAQDAFIEAGGSPARNAGSMDPDGDGVACEDLPAPFKGYATIGYHRGEAVPLRGGDDARSLQRRRSALPDREQKLS